MNTTPPVLLTHASQMLTLRGPRAPRRGPQMLDLSIIPDGALLMHRGAILAVGSTNEVANHTLAAGAEEVDCRGKVVLLVLSTRTPIRCLLLLGWWTSRSASPVPAMKR